MRCTGLNRLDARNTLNVERHDAVKSLCMAGDMLSSCSRRLFVNMVLLKDFVYELVALLLKQ